MRRLSKLPSVAVAAAVLLIGCGDDQRGMVGESSPHTAAPVLETVPQMATTTLPAAPPATVDSALGTVSFEAPASTGSDPLATRTPSNVVGYGQWLVADCCRLKLVLQDFRPPIPRTQLLETVRASDLSWDVYDIGPEDGTMIHAVTTVGGLTITVATQALFPGEPAARSPRDVVDEVIGTLSVSSPA